jgi:hypothetical protein
MNGVRLMVVGNSMEAETICGLLRTEGIACDHRHTDVGAGAGDAVGDSGPREVLVARDDLESARQLVTTDPRRGALSFWPRGSFSARPNRYWGPAPLEAPAGSTS